MLGCGDAKWCGMTYGLHGSGVRAISATCSGREVVEPGARAKTSVLDAIGCHGRDIWLTHLNFLLLDTSDTARHFRHFRKFVKLLMWGGPPAGSLHCT